MGYKLIIVFSLVLIPNIAVAQNYTPQQCPVIGNTTSHIYHTQGGHFYRRMLQKNRGKDNRHCFQTTQQARQNGYRASKR